MEKVNEKDIAKYFNMGYELARRMPDICEALASRIKDKNAGYANSFLAGMKQWENVDMGKSMNRKNGYHLDSGYPELDHDEPEMEI